MDNRSSTDQPEQPEWLKANPDSLTAVISDNTHSADALDLQILHALQVDGRVGFGLLGRVLGVSDQTVARRYARMRSASGLRVAAAGDARLLGHRQWYVRVRTTPDAVMAIAQAIARHPDTAWVRLVSGGTEIVCSLRAGHRPPRCWTRALPISTAGRRPRSSARTSAPRSPTGSPTGPGR